MVGHSASPAHAGPAKCRMRDDGRRRRGRRAASAASRAGATRRCRQSMSAEAPDPIGGGGFRYQRLAESPYQIFSPDLRGRSPRRISVPDPRAGSPADRLAGGQRVRVHLSAASTVVNRQRHRGIKGARTPVGSFRQMPPLAGGVQVDASQGGGGADNSVVGAVSAE